MSEEVRTLEANNTWSLAPLPLGKHTIGCCWVYKLKLNSDGSVGHHKARLVGKGYTNRRELISRTLFLRWQNSFQFVFCSLLLQQNSGT